MNTEITQTEPGASLEEHLAAQAPAEWPADVQRSDVPAYQAIAG